MLGRLRIRQKLGVLLAIPLTAMALVMAAFAVDRVGQARAYATTADAALAAREIGGLIQTLQQERLLAVSYLVLPSLDRSAVVTQGQTAAAETARLAAGERTAEIVQHAGPRLDALARLRPSILDHTATPTSVFVAYQETIATLMEALDLARLPAADTDGLRELLALDALMRSNEDASSIGATVVTAWTNPSFRASELATAVDSNAANLERFRQLAEPQQAALVDTVESGEAAQRLRRYAIILVGGGSPGGEADISEALAAAITYTGLRRVAQDRVARDAALDAQNDATGAATAAAAVALGAAVLFLGVAALAVIVGRSIARPLGRLGRAVGAVAELSRAELVRVTDSEAFDTAPPALASVEVDTDDEIGELATAVNRVQSTAAMLLERQATARANVATMFANVSRRTQNLVGRQLSMIEELTRQEADQAARDRLLQLQHITTRLRRSADSLLVVSGTVEQQLSAMPARLAAILDGALQDIEGYQRVEVLEPLPDVAIGAELALDLRLLLGELLENATNFTPPGSAIRIGAAHDRETSFAADATIVIVDQGLGMSPARMDDENRRLVERERLDVTPTRVLGLFVVGRLARRHGLTVRLEPTPGHGVTAVVRIPARWLTPASVPSGPAGFGVVPPLAAAAIESASRSGPFPWLSTRPDSTETVAPVTGAPVSAAPVTGAPVGAAPVIGAPITGAPIGVAPALGTPVRPAPRVVAPATPPAAVPPRSARLGPPIRPRRARDPEAERESVNAYLSGFARGAAEPGPDAEPGTEPPTAGSGRSLEDTPPDSAPAERVEPTLAERHQ
jgi:signal transduction histidine kinase